MRDLFIAFDSINMFLRWMVYNDLKALDDALLGLGIEENF